MGEFNMKLTIENLKNLVKEVIEEEGKRKVALFETSRASYCMHRLDETTMTALQGKYNEQGYIVLTSDRTCAAEKGLPYGSKCPDEDEEAQEQKNLQNREQLKQQIRAAGFGFTPTLGGYKEKIQDDSGEVRLVDTDKPEHSFLIMAQNDKPGLDYNALRDFGIQIAKQYNQDSFFFKPPDNVDPKSYYIKQDGSIDKDFSGKIYGDTNQEDYTQLAKGSEKYDPKKRFTALPESLMFPVPPSNASEARSRRGEVFVPRKRGAK